MDLVIRLAGPVQTWAGYRATHSTVHTSPLPTKSGVAGLLGACLGVRDYLALVPRFALDLRVDRTNAVEHDLQVAVPPPPGRPTTLWHRSAALHAITASVREGTKVTPYKVPKDINITDGTNRVQFSPERTFVPHAEFTCRVRVADEGLAGELRAAMHRPRFMPYLGRMANAPSFPFFLGSCPGSTGDTILTDLPHVPVESARLRQDYRPMLRVYTIDGDYSANHPTLCNPVTPPVARSRREQLDWAKEHLER